MDTRVILRFQKIQPNLADRSLYVAKDAIRDFDSFDEAKEFVRENGATVAIAYDTMDNVEFFDGRDWAPLGLAQRIR